MKVIRDEKTATWTFVPRDGEEEQILLAITEILKPGDKLGYKGRSDDEGKFCVVHLNVGGHQEDVMVGGVTHIGAYVGGIDFVLRGTTEEDKYEVNGIRNTCYFGSGELIFLGEVEVDGKKAIVITAAYCKLCGAAMIDFRACEWSVCDACAAKCEHQYKRGPIGGSGLVDIGVGEYCGICGRAEPKSAERAREMSPAERHLEVERELGIMVVYKNTILTPGQIAYLEEVARHSQ